MPWWARLHHTMKFSACGGVIYFKE